MSHDPLSVTLFLNFCDTDSLGHLRQLPVSQTRLSYTRPSIVPFSFYSLSFFGVGVYEFRQQDFSHGYRKRLPCAAMCAVTKSRSWQAVPSGLAGAVLDKEFLRH